MPFSPGTGAWRLAPRCRARRSPGASHRPATFVLSLTIALLAVVSACSPQVTPPQIRISSDRIPRHWKLEVRGNGFTPTHSVTSHLRRSDGSEFPVLPILTDASGEFTHSIDTMILELGVHELWVVDDQSGRTSNRVQFDVTFDYPPG
jgi:hypothetical protein